MHRMTPNWHWTQNSDKNSACTKDSTLRLIFGQFRSTTTAFRNKRSLKIVNVPNDPKLNLSKSPKYCAALGCWCCKSQKVNRKPWKPHRSVWRNYKDWFFVSETCVAIIYACYAVFVASSSVVSSFGKHSGSLWLQKATIVNCGMPVSGIAKRFCACCDVHTRVFSVARGRPT